MTDWESFDVRCRVVRLAAASPQGVEFRLGALLFTSKLDVLGKSGAG
jgi:hypothetical protein